MIDKKPKKEEQPEELPQGLITASYARERIIAEVTPISQELYDKSRYGEVKGNKISYSLPEALLLMEKSRLQVVDGKKAPMSYDEFVKKARRVEPNFWIRYCIFRDLRNRGYIVKTALKFGADFRVYDRGVKPGDDHAKWIVYPVHESDVLTWYEFSAKNRVAHSTRKRLLIGVVDEEDDCSYWEARWLRP